MDNLLRSCASGAFYKFDLHGGVSLHFRAVDHRFGTYPCHQRNTVLPFPATRSDAAAISSVKIFTDDVRVRLGHGHHDGVLAGTNWADYSEVRRRHLRCRLYDRGAARVLPGVHVPWACCSGASACRRRFYTWCRNSWLVWFAWLCRPCGSSSRTRGCRPRRAGCPPTGSEGRHHRLPLTAAMNPSVWPQLLAHHRAVLIMARSWLHGRFRVVHLIKNRHKEFAMKTV